MTKLNSVLGVMTSIIVISIATTTILQSTHGSQSNLSFAGFGGTIAVSGSNVYAAW
jgi:hypothetical protein